MGNQHMGRKFYTGEAQSYVEGVFQSVGTVIQGGSVSLSGHHRTGNSPLARHLLPNSSVAQPLELHNVFLMYYVFTLLDPLHYSVAREVFICIYYDSSLTQFLLCPLVDWFLSIPKEMFHVDIVRANEEFKNLCLALSFLPIGQVHDC